MNNMKTKSISEAKRMALHKPIHDEVDDWSHPNDPKVLRIGFRKIQYKLIVCDELDKYPQPPQRIFPPRKGKAKKK